MNRLVSFPTPFPEAGKEGLGFPPSPFPSHPYRWEGRERKWGGDVSRIGRERRNTGCSRVGLYERPKEAIDENHLTRGIELEDYQLGGISRNRG